MNLPLRRRLCLLALALALAILPGCSTPGDSSATRGLSAPAGLEEWVASEATRLGAREFPVTRLQTEGDLDRDGRPDSIWVYRLDGSGSLESFHQFLAIQLSRDPRRIRSLQVGKSGGRSISEVRIVEEKVELHAQEYLPTDPSCCPTGRTTLRVGLRSGQLEFLNP
jgi:hypothetical protein